MLPVTTRFAPCCYTLLLPVTTRLCSLLLHACCSLLLHAQEMEKTDMWAGLDEVRALQGWRSGNRQCVFGISARTVWMKTVWMINDGEMFIAPPLSTDTP